MAQNDKAAPLNVAKLFTSLAAVFKAAPADKLADLNDAIDHAGVDSISDMWNEPRGEHKAPSRAEIVTGPAERMSSSGAEKMIGEYSELSNQSGLTALYAKFENILSDYSKSHDRKFTALAGVVSDMAKGYAALEAAVKAAAEPEAPAAPAEDTFFGKAQTKMEKARKAFRKAEMDEDEDEREERKSKLTSVADLLKSALKLISKADDDEKNDEDEVEKAVQTIKSLQARVTAALAVITKAEEDEAEEKKEAEKANQPAAATVKAEDTEEEKKDDTAKSFTADDIKKSLEGLSTLPTTLDGFIQAVMGRLDGVSKTLATPPNMTVIKGGLDGEAQFRAAVDAGEVVGVDVVRGQTLFARKRAAANGQYPQAKLDEDVAASSAALRRFFG